LLFQKHKSKPFFLKIKVILVILRKISSGDKSA
jgi:hypothetical protein